MVTILYVGNGENGTEYVLKTYLDFAMFVIEGKS